MKNLEKNIPEGVEIIWDESCKQNYIQFIKNGTTYKMWLEDEKSVMYKLELINQYKLAGAGFWVKGFEKDSIWGIIKEKLNI